MPLVKVMEAKEEKGFKIPPPKDPKERAEYEAAVARRKSSGAGMFVGDDAKWGFNKWSAYVRAECQRLNVLTPSDRELADFYEEDLTVREAVGKMERSDKIARLDASCSTLSTKLDSSLRSDASYHFSRGKAAAEAGEQDSPPYPEGSAFSREWRDGYKSAKKDKS